MSHVSGLESCQSIHAHAATRNGLSRPSPLAIRPLTRSPSFAPPSAAHPPTSAQEKREVIRSMSNEDARARVATSTSSSGMRRWGEGRDGCRMLRSSTMLRPVVARNNTSSSSRMPASGAVVVGEVGMQLHHACLRTEGRDSGSSERA